MGMPACQISSDDAGYALNLVKVICASVGPGLPGSGQERERAAVFQKELESHLGSANVAVEEFTLAPGGFLSPFPGIFLLAAVLLNLSQGAFPDGASGILAAAALVFAILSPALFLFEFVLGRELIDPLLPKRRSQNVIGALRGPDAGEVNRLLIVSGHHDSAPENVCLRFFGYGFFFFAATFVVALVAMVAMCAIQVAGLAAGNPGVAISGTLGWALLAYPMAPAVAFGLFAIRGTEGGGNVPGAVDNLSGSAVAVALCRFLVRHPGCVPGGTEVRFVSFGSEEAGLRGSRRYVARHLEELKRLDARLLNVEMVAHPEVGILRSDLNGVVKHSPENVRSVAAAARRAGVPTRSSPRSWASVPTRPHSPGPGSRPRRCFPSSRRGRWWPSTTRGRTVRRS